MLKNIIIMVSIALFIEILLIIIVRVRKYNDSKKNSLMSVLFPSNKKINYLKTTTTRRAKNHRFDDEHTPCQTAGLGISLLKEDGFKINLNINEERTVNARRKIY